MNLLLDTHVLLWAAASPEQLPADALSLINDENNRLYFSAASIWEVVIKNSLQRPDFQVDPHLLRRGLVDNGYLELPISSLHTLNVAHLPSIHKDPFDRILVAQAEAEGFLLITADELVAQYAGPIRKV
ncbi:type II toxin-antitoxin system VapC family toxin [Halomonas sp. AOP13-D3-9]|uniref:Type II toxin-antitoxin system VapC family toxin n=1 Tax=Vreelandella titanicae TaxID=664683 RepID=A0A558J2U3_9GAMM|nr:MULTISPECIES: type II toxin-antitoxin system VapC family toxin [Halomonas]MBR9905705.1 type II toxin-antitoxin system VapC family toxin [Gammaproteobacteria bacterium]TVU87864.1 type II toxin-antitoxin system VapC family toxin [Halomonas titanicae]CEP36706.1 PilT protein domain-containing protein [Halomonas sp. R57-5]